MNDEEIQQVIELLKPTYPTVEVIRGTNRSIWVRVLDTAFENRDDDGLRNEFNSLLNKLPQDIYRKISMVVVTAPKHVHKFGFNQAFEDAKNAHR